MTESKPINGIDVTHLIDTIEKIKQDRNLAKFKFRVTNRWVEGTHNQAEVKGFYGAGQEDESRKPLIFDIDEPPVLCGNNRGANPVEFLLVALSGCLTTSLVAHAAARGINIQGVESRYEGDIDLRGFLGLSEEVPVGYQTIRVFFKVEADLSETEKNNLIEMAQKYSPVFNSVTKVVPVSVELDPNR